MCSHLNSWVFHQEEIRYIQECDTIYDPSIYDYVSSDFISNPIPGYSSGTHNDIITKIASIKLPSSCGEGGDPQPLYRGGWSVPKRGWYMEAKFEGKVACEMAYQEQKKEEEGKTVETCMSRWNKPYVSFSDYKLCHLFPHNLSLWSTLFPHPLSTH